MMQHVLWMKIRRWTNLWWATNIVQDVVPECTVPTEASDIGTLEFVGNLLLIVLILSVIFLLHVAIISGVEATWLARVGQSQCKIGCRTPRVPLPRSPAHPGTAF